MNKKLVSLFTLFTILVSMLSITANASLTVEDAVNEEWISAQKLLASVGIISEEDKLENSDFLTRGETMKYLVRMTGLPVIEDDSISYFYDVGSNNENKNYINSAYKYGIVIGTSDMHFSPEQMMTPNMLTTCLLRIAGYADYIKYAGESRVNKEKQAIMKNVTQNVNEPLTAGNMLLMIKNALELPYANVVSIEADGGSVSYDKIYDNTQSVLYNLLGIKIIQAKLVASPDVAIGGRELSPKGKVVVLTEDEKFEKFYDCFDDSITDYVGFDINIYADDDKIVYFESDDDVEDIIIDGCDVESVIGQLGGINYFEASKSKKMYFDFNTIFVYNGRMCYEVVNNDFLNNPDTIRILDFNNDKTADVVYIWKYDVMHISYVSVNGGFISDSITNTELLLDTESNEYDVEMYFKDEPISLTKISKDMIATVALSRSTPQIKQKRTVYFSSKTASGVVNEIDRAEHKIVVENDEYNTTEVFDFTQISVGKNFNFAINYFGEIAKIIAADIPDLRYGYLFEIWSESGLDESVSAKIFDITEKNTEIFRFADKFKHNGNPYSSKTGNFGDMISTNFGNTLPEQQQIVSYRLNGDGQIREIYSAGMVKGMPEDSICETLTLNFDGKTKILKNYVGGKYVMSSDTNVLRVGYDEQGIADEDSIQFVDYSSQYEFKTQVDRVRVYDSSNYGVPKVVLIDFSGTSNSSTVRYRNRPFIVNKSTKKLDVNGDVKTVLYGYEAQQQKVLTVADNVNVNRLLPGMAITYELNGKGEISEYYLKFASNTPEWYSDDIALFGDGEYTSYKPAYVGIDGYDYLGAAITVYGKLKSKTASNVNVIQIDVAGEEESISYEINANIQSVKFDSESRGEYITDIPWNDIEIGADVFVFAKNGKIWDIVWYK